MEIMRSAMFLLPLVLSLLHPTSATSGPDFNYGAHPRFVCSPIPADADPSCFPTAGTGAGSTGPGGSNHQNVPPSGWWGAGDEAKATILHLRESLVQQKEIILDQRETIRELTAKLTMCEGAGRGPSLHDEHHGSVSYSHHKGLSVHHTSYTDNSHYGNGRLIPDSQHHHSSVQRSDGGYGGHNHGKDKHGTAGDSTSTTEQLERMLHALKERLSSLQKRNSTSTYSNSLKELLQRKISTLEEQLHHHTAALGSSADQHRDDDSGHRDDGDHHDDGHHDDNHRHDDERHDVHDDTGDHKDHHDDSHSKDHHDGDHDDHDEGDDSEGDDSEGDDSEGDDSEGDDSDSEEDEDEEDEEEEQEEEEEEEEEDDHRSNETEDHSYLPHTGYRTGFHSNKLETMLNQLHLTASNRKHSKNLDAFQISFPMRTNYMYGRMKRTLLQEIFALTLCLWMKAGVGPGLGTPFSYSAPGQANELVLIEWGNNPIELLIDDKAVTLPLSLSDGKWHHVCVTWTTRDGQWEAYQDGVKRGSGTNLSPWHSIKPGGVFILGQEQDTLGGRFDATQSYVGEMSDLHMWSHALSAADIYSLASCGSHLRGDIIDWSESEVELHGGVARYPFDPCH
ncbi:neuronal pentraxin-1-like isoform X1 [Xiphophorus maculatus]|uniref:Neuronal pentraxin-1-like n=1 Tax=Xiphophorus maculatus TaxID=8083 RepID=M4ACZ7_XIPMA|nr:neuronal pentraxin-1-like isoform X1 [Xiphophorus maculatus]XP_023186565.1 neuronal pentraxin-1-like isoform X1 [Xiphophorus maculatus]